MNNTYKRILKMHSNFNIFQNLFTDYSKRELRLQQHSACRREPSVYGSLFCNR
uniref:Uncharacterized protein n=1 Tax=Arundo donax TaxID=35708 RepID=A0A0A8Z9H4_ARUDO